MSLETTLARVSQLSGLVALQPTAPAAAESSAPPSASFRRVLQAKLGESGSHPDLPYAGAIEAASRRYGVDPALIRAVIERESGFDPSATSSAGAAGLMQLMPETARALGIVDPYDPAQSIDGGTRYLAAQLRRFGDVGLALAAYNAGPGAVEHFGGIPPYQETRRYVESVLARYRTLASGPAGGEIS